MSNQLYPTQDLIDAAHERVRPYIYRTPILTSRTLNALSGAEIFFKCENFQKIGAFKARGGVNAVMSMTSDERAKGVATHSSGNHAQAIAYAASVVGVPAYIVMPDNSPEVKINAVKSYGAEVTFCTNTPEERERTLQEVVTRTGAAFVHPFDDYRVIAGQATAAKELIEDVGQAMDFFMTPVGGGGLLSGTSLAARYYSPGTRVIAGEPQGAADAILSFQTGIVQRAPYVKTIADGLLTPLSEKTLGIILENVSDVLLVTDDEIIAAMRLIWERMKLVVEPSGAVPLAALLKYREQFAGRKVGIVISGGNVDLGKLPF